MSSNTNKERPVTTEERQLLRSQKKSIDQLTKLALKSDKISDEDRKYFQDVFHGKVSGTDVDMEMVKRIASSDSDLSNAFGKWSKDTSTLNDKYGSKLQGISDDFVTTIKSAGDEYRTNAKLETDKLQQLASDTQANMGKADEDIYARTKGAYNAGISQAASDAQKQAIGNIASRGLAGSGIDTKALVDMQSRQQGLYAGANAKAYGDAVGMSDSRRMSNLQTQMSASGQINNINQGIYGSATNDAGMIANSQSGVAGTQYGIGSQFASQQFSNTGMVNQQAIGNLQMASGIGRGIYQGAANYSGQAMSGYNSSGAQAGQQAQYLGNAQAQYRQQQVDSNNAQWGAVGSLVGTGVGAFAALV